MPSRTGDSTWRERHPVLARALLYGFGALLLGGVVLLLVERAAVDKADRIAYLEARLGGMDLILAKDPSGRELLRVLDDEFEDPDLPAKLRGPALRARAFALLQQGELRRMEEAFSAAQSLTESDVDHTAIRIERAQALVNRGESARALALLEGDAPVSHPVIGLWWAMTRGSALAQAGRKEEVLRGVEAALDSLPRPLPELPAIHLGVSTWTPIGAAHHATLELDHLLPQGAPVAAWERLLAFAPSDLDVFPDVVRGLYRAGAKEQAAGLWSLFSGRVTPERAAELAAADPILGALENALKPAPGVTR